MSQHIDAALEDWDYQRGAPQARLVDGGRGRQVLQFRLDLGVLQMEITGRPDGTQPHGHPTYFEYLRAEARRAAERGKSFVLSEEQCEEADREFVQYYHRRISWLALRRHAEAVADADHTLAFMDFTREHSPSDEYTKGHEQYRGFVLFQRTQAATALAIDGNDPERGVDEVRFGLDRLHAFFADHDLEEQFEENGMVQHLRKIERFLRREHGIEATLREQLSEAVAREEYEAAARIRDALRRRG
jgi:hypothetical protein